MSGIAAVSGQMSSAVSASFAMPSGAAGAAAAGSTGGNSGAEAVAGAGLTPAGALSTSTSVQTSALINSAQPNANIQNMAALILSMLLSKSDETKDKDKDDAWKMLAGMALLGAMAQQNQNVSLTQSTSVVTESYGAQGAVAAATGAGVNVQA